MQELKHFVKTCRVTSTNGANRECSFETRNEIGLQKCFACAHPVAVALNRVDFAVVSDESIWVSQRPRRESIRGEAAVHQSQGTLDSFISKIGIERPELRSREHALVNNRAATQRREIGLLFGWKIMFDSLTSHEHFAVKIDT